MIKANQSKNIFCLEGLWDHDLRNRSSVLPVLKLLWRVNRLNYIHRDCATRAEFEFYVKKWSEKRYDKYPILYLPFHGTECEIVLSDKTCSLLDIGEFLEKRCTNRVIVLGACSTLHIHKNIIKVFLKRTDALAVCGYRTDVGWMLSTAFELLLLEAMQDNEFSGRGIEAIAKKAEELGKRFKELDFRMVTSKEL